MHQNSFPSLKKVLINYQKATILEAWQPRSLERAGKPAGWFVGHHRRLHVVSLDITILIPVLGIIFMTTTRIDVLIWQVSNRLYFSSKSKQVIKTALNICLKQKRLSYSNGSLMLNN